MAHSPGMHLIGLKRARTVAGLLPALILASVLVGPGAAQASHDNGTALCDQKFDGTFNHLHNFPPYRNGPGSTRVGRVSVNAQWRRQGREYRVCAVTIRRWHGKPKDTWAWVSRNGAFYRLDRGQFYRYAGPVVGGMREGQRLTGGGRLLGACAGFGVTWREGGRPRLEGGGCA
jgi:hypothetical protein